MKKIYYAGIDYHKNYSTVCILDAERSVVVEATVRPNTKEGFADVFSRVDGKVKTTFECGLNWGRLFDILEALPMVSDVVLANALQTRIIAEAQVKTDKIDAQKLAWLLHSDLIPSIHIPNRDTRQRREVIRQRMYWGSGSAQVRGQPTHFALGKGSRGHPGALRPVRSGPPRGGEEGASMAEMPGECKIGRQMEGGIPAPSNQG